MEPSDVEDGEILDDDETIFDPRRVKRNRDSESPDDSFGGFRRERSRPRRSYYQDGESERWNEWEDDPNRYSRQQSVESSRGRVLGPPRAHSTAGGIRSAADQNRQRETNQRAQAPIIPSTNLSTSDPANASRSFMNKMFKVEPFPKNLKPTDQYHEWTFWLANFEMAVEKAGTTDQRPRAIDLSLHIGEEVRRIIVASRIVSWARFPVLRQSREPTRESLSRSNG